MPRYRETDTRWLRVACVAGAYCVAVATLFTLRVGAAVALPIVVAVAAPPLLYAALSMVMLRAAPLVRRVSWVGGACLTHVLLGVLAAAELMWAGRLPPMTALAQVFVLFAPAPALALLATPLVLGLVEAAPRPVPRAEGVAPRRSIPPTSHRPRSFVRSTAAHNDASPGMAPASSVFSPPTTRVAPPSVPPPAAPSPLPPVLAPPQTSGASSSAATPMEPPATPMEPPATPMEPPATPNEAAEALVTPPLEQTPAVPYMAAEGPVSRGDDAMVRISFARIADQLPAEAFVLPFDRLAESLKEPNALLVPRRIVLAQMREGRIAIGWQTVAGQFPELALGMSAADFRYRYPNLTLSLPVDEVLAQLPPDTIPLASAVLSAERLEVPPPITPPSNPSNGATAVRRAVPAPSRVASVIPPAWSPVATPPLGTPVTAGPPQEAPPPVTSTAAAALVEREAVARIVAGFGGVGALEAAVERIGATAVVALVGPGVEREAVAACAAAILRVISADDEVVTVRTTRAVVVLAHGPIPVVVGAYRPGAPVALLELRAARAALGTGPRALASPGSPRGPLQALGVEGREARAAQALTSFGAVEPSVFTGHGARVYVFSARGRDATPLGGLALGICEALGRGDGRLGALVSVVFRRAGERTLVRPLAGGAAALAATGPVTHPGRMHRDAERAAAVLEAP